MLAIIDMALDCPAAASSFGMAGVHFRQDYFQREALALAGPQPGSYNGAVLVLAHMLMCAVKRETRCRHGGLRVLPPQRSTSVTEVIK
jgi:hypothetical protein